jgi:hypothetical protein
MSSLFTKLFGKKDSSENELSKLNFPESNFERKRRKRDEKNYGSVRY